MEVSFCVIMPCYNSAKYVRDAVDSLLAQQYPNWNLIAVNDGSTDDTLNILKEYATNDSRIKVFSKENGGYVSAVNMGLDNVSGDYFLLMGSDDRLVPSLFEEIIKHITNELPDMIGFRALKVENGEIVGKDSISDFDSFTEMYQTKIREYEECYQKQSRIMFVRDTAKCFKTENLEDLRYFGKYGYDADGIFSTLFAQKCRSFMSIPVDGYLWTIRSDSLSANTTEKVDFDRLENWIKYYQLIKQYDKDSLADYAKEYISFLNGVGCYLIIKAKKYNKDINTLVNTARVYYFEAIEKYNLDGIHFRHRLLGTIFRRMPTVWNYMYRLRNRREA